MIYKTLPKKIRPDVCQLSLDWLENHAYEWFKENIPNHGKIWFSDENSKHLIQDFPKKDEFVEIILTGSFLHRLLESKLWPFENFRIWTFSTRVKSYLVDAFKFQPEDIGVIGRFNTKQEIQKPIFKKSVNLVYAGRLSLAKNITSLIRLTSELQSKHNCEVTLDIYGLPDDLEDPSLGRFETYNLDQEFNELINRLNWKEKPSFHESVPQGEWLKIARENPVFISLSTSMHEDFGTAAEIATQAGWPCLLSDWGGHADANRSFKIPYHLVPRTHEPEFIQTMKTKSLAELLVSDNWDLCEDHAISYMSRPLERKEFDSCIDQFIQYWGQSLLLILRNETARFADTPKGRNLFKNYHYHFGKIEGTKALIVNDLKTNPPFNLAAPIEKFEVIFVRDLFCPYYIKRWASFDEIQLINLAEELQSIVYFLKNQIGFASVIKLYLEDTDSFKRRDLLSTEDQLIRLTV